MNSKIIQNIMHDVNNHPDRPVFLTAADAMKDYSVSEDLILKVFEEMVNNGQAQWGNLDQDTLVFR